MVYLYSTIKMMHGPINLRVRKVLYIGSDVSCTEGSQFLQFIQTSYEQEAIYMVSKWHT